MKTGALVFIFLSFFTLCTRAQKKKEPFAIKIEWQNNLPGDFSFTREWSYPEGVEKKADGKAGCADGGFCPSRCYNMLDSNGIVRKDSSRIFYQVLDTTHRYHTIQCEAWCYEWAGTDFIKVLKRSNSGDAHYCATEMNMATHCSFKMTIKKDNCFPTIELVSIIKDGNAEYIANGGSIRIDKKLWKKDIMKAEFSFTFDHPEDPKKPIFWKGRIYAEIKSIF